MNSQELRNLQEAYLDVYELDEERKEDKIIRQQGSPRTQKQKEEKRNKETGLSTSTRTILHQKSRNPYGRNSSYHHDLSMKLGLGKYNDKEGNPQYGGHYSRHPKSYDMDLKKYNRYLNRDENTPFKESYDLYDIILSHLLDEGYAETQEQAEVIMVNMSEDWRESIIG